MPRRSCPWSVSACGPGVRKIFRPEFHDAGPESHASAGRADVAALGQLGHRIHRLRPGAAGKVEARALAGASVQAAAFAGPRCSMRTGRNGATATVRFALFTTFPSPLTIRIRWCTQQLTAQLIMRCLKVHIISVHKNWPIKVDLPIDGSCDQLRVGTIDGDCRWVAADRTAAKSRSTSCVVHC